VTFPRRTTVAAAAVAAALGAVGVADWAVAAKGGKPTGANPKPLTVTGSVADLFPGGTARLDVVVTNTNNAAIAVTSVDVEATDAGPSCRASVLTFATPPPGQVIEAGQTSSLPVAVTMAEGAPDACQGVTFPLRHTVTGTRAR
jgi:hypothetical protein